MEEPTKPEDQVEMIQGETGAQLPAGYHGRAHSMPDETDSHPSGVLPAMIAVSLLVVLGLLALIAIALLL